MKLKALFIALIGASMINLTACGDDDEPKTKSEKTETSSGSQESSNPMAGKTIRCNKVYEEPNDVRITTNFSITFNDETHYTQVLKQRSELYWAHLGRWEDEYVLDNTLYGTYSYSASEIRLYDEDGASNGTLKKVSDGWAEGEYIYK